MSGELVDGAGRYRGTPANPEFASDFTGGPLPGTWTLEITFYILLSGDIQTYIDFAVRDKTTDDWGVEAYVILVGGSGLWYAYPYVQNAGGSYNTYLTGGVDVDSLLNKDGTSANVYRVEYSPSGVLFKINGTTVGDSGGILSDVSMDGILFYSYDGDDSIAIVESDRYRLFDAGGPNPEADVVTDAEFDAWILRDG